MRELVLPGGFDLVSPSFTALLNSALKDQLAELTRKLGEIEKRQVSLKVPLMISMKLLTLFIVIIILNVICEVKKINITV
ncbi:unnamed protein product [Schistosoma margrebowiei]|uniref:Uncharacterized protein n=1 Tax=Schistosoma margrebowiei TaxID=48269 RepID=A0A3P8E0J5_9TREM|nr:unnamed protein product [Schistosoma margrebowiei]